MLSVFYRALQEDFDKEPEMKKLFSKVRVSVRLELRIQLTNFRESLKGGLVWLFGATDQDLQQCIVNRNKELQIIEHVLFPYLEKLV